MKPWKHNLFIVLAVLVILSLLLSACVTIKIGGSSNHDNKEKNKHNDDGNKDKNTNADKITICHKTGSAKHPYVEISISKNAVKNGHAKHNRDIIPAPKNGCPKTVIATETP